MENKNNSGGQGAGASSNGVNFENGLALITQDVLRRLFLTQEENKELARRTHDLCKGNTELLSQSLRSKMELENVKKELEKVRELVAEREEVNVHLAHGIVKTWRTMHGQLLPPHQAESDTETVPVSDVQNMLEDIYQHVRRNIVMEAARYSQSGGSAHFQVHPHGNCGGHYYSASGCGCAHDPYGHGHYNLYGNYGNGGVAPSAQAPAASAAIGARPNQLQQREQFNVVFGRGERMVRAQEPAAALQGPIAPGIIRGANAAVNRSPNAAAAAVQAHPVPQPQPQPGRIPGIAHGEDHRRREEERRRRAAGPYAHGRWMRLGRSNAGAGGPNSMMMQPALMMVPLALGNQFGGSLMDGFGYIGNFDRNNNVGGGPQWVEREWEADEEEDDEGEGEEDGDGEGEGEEERPVEGAARAAEER